MPQRIKISGWEIEIPDCWRIEYNNFPKEIFRVEYLTSFDHLYKAVSDTDYTMTVNWIPPKSNNGVFIFRIANGKGFNERHYSEQITDVSSLASKIELYAHGLCSPGHKKLWTEGGDVYSSSGERYLIAWSTSKPVYYQSKDRYFKFENEVATVYDAKKGKEIFRKNLHNAEIKGVINDPFERGFLVFFDDLTEYRPRIAYKDIESQETKDGIESVTITNPKANEFPPNYSNLGLFNENMDAIWWAEPCRVYAGINSSYFNLRKHGKDYLEFSGYGAGIKLDPKTGKIIGSWVEKG